MSSAGPGGDALLLRALLASGDAAAIAGSEWLDRVDLTAITPDEQRVLPLLYKRLVDAGFADIPPLLKGVYRHSWARNTTRARDLVAVIGALETAGIPSIVVKGMALVDYYGNRWGARDMYDGDLLVRTADAARAIEVLVGDGWGPREGATVTTLRARLLDHRGGWPFVGRGDLELDLHWHLFHTSLGPRADHDVWAACELFALDGRSVRRPHPADLVLHACEQGSVDAGGARFVCASDVATITRRVGAEAIGARLAENARRHSLLARTRDFVELVAAGSESPEVAGLARRLAATRPRRLERALVAATARPQSWRTDLVTSIRRQAGGRTRLAEVARGLVRERVEPALLDSRVASVLYALTGRRAWLARWLRQLRMLKTTTPASPFPPVGFGEWIDFNDATHVDRFGGPGWSFSDDTGTWTDGAEARIVLPLATPVTGDLVVTMEALPYCVVESPARTIELRANDRSVARMHFDPTTVVPGLNTITMRIEHAVARRRAPLELALVVRRPVAPATLGLSADGRRVGLLLRRLRVDLDR